MGRAVGAEAWVKSIFIRLLDRGNVIMKKLSRSGRIDLLTGLLAS